MLVGRDLGLPNLVVLVVVLVIFPAIGFVIRRKWQHAAARREEIKRLLIFASEETARAEIEATEGYFYTANTSSSWIPAPDSTWDSVPVAPLLKPQYQCAVCFSPTATRCAKCKAVYYCSGRCQIIHWRQGHKDECIPYVSVKPVRDVSGSSFKQEDSKDPNDTLTDDNRPEIRSVFQSTSESLSSEEYSTFSTASRSSTETSSGSSVDFDVSSENLVTVQSSTGSGKVNQKKSNHSAEDIQPRFSTSSSRVDDGSNGSSFSEPSTTSSGFWSGTILSKKSTIDKVDGFEPSGSKEKTAILDNSAPSGSGSKNSNDEISPPKYTSQMLKHRDVVGDSDLSQSMFNQNKISSFGAGDHSAVGAKPSSVLERSNHVVNNKSMTSPVFKSMSRLASQSTKPATTVHEEEDSVAKVTQLSGSGRNGLKTPMLKVVDQLKPSELHRQGSERTESDTSHKYSSKGLFSYEMFVKLYNWKHVEFRPFGLINCGNSCYANAVLQCLTHTPPLYAYLLQGLHSKACDKRDWCFTCEFEGLVLKAKNGNSSLSPVRILSQIENIGSSLGHGREEDAHEFLRYAINTLQSVCLKEAGTNATNALQEETTLIGLTFGGYLRSKIQCMKCGGKSERHEQMMDLTVEIEGNIGTLEEALDKFTHTEMLDGENKYKCGRCKSYEKAKKKLTLLEAPNVLTIALKRFQSGKFGKLNKSIHFPEILDMAPYMSGTSDRSPVYRLYGVVEHVDMMNAVFSGHYVCYVKNIENRWFKIDDNIVKEVDVQSVMTKRAYMLLYARCSPRAPRLIRGLISRHHHDPRKHKMSTSRSHFTQPWNINHDHLAIRHRTLEEESSSSDSSGIFSESCSCSTEGSHRDSGSIEDHISWDWEHEYNSNNRPWRNMHLNSSDSDASSSSSSSFPSPLYSRHSTLYHNDRKVSCSNSCREGNVDRLGGRPTNPSETSKPTLRRSTTQERSE
ncbi:hypothetical protein L1987_46454 [Smallanthus sonchifolius]|uniref:Uncharacterized protein n=1 Tax=Smallanthus sonchifolius TaxID=185202 RepID=A0ACB9G0U7_9ASTR|nr:hypothetical protein L1987_46454 [Smallanthus sonchifolius]